MQVIADLWGDDGQYAEKKVHALMLLCLIDTTYLLT